MADGRFLDLEKLLVKIPIICAAEDRAKIGSAGLRAG